MSWPYRPFSCAAAPGSCKKLLCMTGVLVLCASGSVGAQTIVGPAEVSRITPEVKTLEPPHTLSPAAEPMLAGSLLEIPQTVRGIRFHLERVSVEGSTLFSEEQFRGLYEGDLGQDVMLPIAWTYAAGVTQMYRDAGYFLSQAYVPDQKGERGEIMVRVTEGYIGQIVLEGPLAEEGVIRAMFAALKAQKPLTSRAMESFLLRLNDLPGVSFRAVLSPSQEQDKVDGSVTLTLVPSDEADRGKISIDNFASRYSGPHEAQLSYETSPLPLHTTRFTGMASLPFERVRSGSLEHRFTAFPDVQLVAQGGWTVSSPQYTLAEYEIESESLTLGVGADYQWIRQRDVNLALRARVEMKDSQTDMLGLPFSEDRMRVLRLGVNADFLDPWGGASFISATFSQGLPILDSSEKDDDDMSRLEAVPDFRKFEVTASRQQKVTDALSVVTSVAGQVADGLLYSSEEFGYGGQTFGRAYDGSEFLGDHGLAGAVEFRYGLKDRAGVTLEPYVFGDTGFLWQKQAAGGTEKKAASSVGGGLRFEIDPRISGNVGVAWPVGEIIGAPPYGGDGAAPRAFFQLSVTF